MELRVLYPASGTSNTSVCLLLPLILLVTSASSLIAELGTTTTSKTLRGAYNKKAHILATISLLQLPQESLFYTAVFSLHRTFLLSPVNVSR